jgi:hypothetical protein
MPADRSSTEPVLKTITIHLNAEAGHQPAEARQELVLGALAAALIAVNDSSSPAWTVQSAHGGEPLLYELTPLDGHIVSVEAAWKMVHALRDQRQIAAAEPAFVTPMFN